MKTHQELLTMRNKLRDRLAKETYLISVHNDERLEKIAGILAGIQAIDLVIENDIDAPEDDGPLGFFVP